MRHAYGNANGDGHIHSDSDCDGNCHIHANCDCDSNCHIHANGDCNSYGNGYSHGYSDCDRIAEVYADATAAPDTAASSVALFRLRELARTNSRVPSLRWIRPPQRDDDKLISEGAHISGGKAASVQRDSGSIDVAVPWRLAPNAQFTTSLRGIAPGLVESKNTSAESAIQFSK